MDEDWDKNYAENIRMDDNYPSDNQPTRLQHMLFDLQTEPERLEDADGNSVIAPPMYRWTTEASTTEPQEPKENKEVLNPHHPLLARFQQTLKAHLTKQIEKLNVEMLELETSIKEEEKHKEALGVMVYDKQQDISRQQNILETVEKDLQDLVAKREKHEEDVTNLRKAHQLEYQELLKAEEQERNLRHETESLTLLEKQLTQWKEEMDSELTINKRISDKSLKDKKQLAEEKRQLDMHIYNLMTDIWKCETEIEQLDVQLRVQEAKKEELENASQDANSNLEALHSQQNSLLKAWNNVLFNLKQRDNQYQEAMETVKNLTGQLRVQISEIEVLKHNIEKEMKENLQINERKSRIENDYTNTTKQIVAEEERLQTLSSELNNQRMIIKFTEGDLNQANTANQEREFELNQIIKDIEKQTLLKVSLEDEIMNHLDECDTNDKAAAHLSKFVRQLKEKCRQLEIKMLNAENTDAKLLVEIEQLKGSNTANIEYINSLKKLHNERDDNVKKLNTELTSLKNSTLMRKRKIDSLTNKLNDLLANTKGQELSPQEVQIRDTEKAIENATAEIRALEINWMREQNNVVNLTQQRNEQIYQLNLLSKQILIIQQKNLQLEDELDKHKRRENEMQRNIDRLLRRLEKLNLEISRNRSINEKEDCQLSICQNKFLDLLQNLERECAQLETDISDLETEKQSLAKQLLEVNREGLMWQKQAQMATEARKAVEEDRTSGESGQMRIEIHRMQVRYNQLRRMQERMIVDLEQCVFRREDIIGKSEAKTKREKGGMSQTRLLFSRKISEIKSKIKQTKKELEQAESNISSCNEQSSMLKEQLENNYNELEKIKKIIPELSQKFEELEIKKHSKLDRLIKSQRKARYYDEIIKGSFKPRSNQILDIELMKQQEFKSNINEIVKQLIYDFPQHKVYLTKILITLGAYHQD